MKIKPLADRVIVEPIDASEGKSAGGIIIPDTAAKEKPQFGKIVAIGKGRLDDNGKAIKMNVKVGEKVYYSPYGGTEITYKGDKYLIMSENDILAVIG